MIKVGVIGLGMMGSTHLDVYEGLDDAQIVALSDIDPDRLSGQSLAKGNIDGMAQGGFDIVNASVKRYDEGKKLIRDKEIDLVDICLPTPMHVEFGRGALKAGKHVMIEKPVARSTRQARSLYSTIEKHPDQVAMVGMCIRFWPGWDWLKQAIDEKRYGKVLSASFQRLSNHPGGPFYSDGEQCGGALLDLHIHDTDFIYHCFGMPQSVTSFGYSNITSAIDHVVTRYEFEEVPIVMAEGGWTMTEGFGFKMSYTVNFERATAVYDLAAGEPLMLYEKDQKPQAITVANELGQKFEIMYLLDCITHGRKPKRVTVEDAINALKIVEAEQKSIKTGRPVKIKI